MEASHIHDHGHMEKSGQDTGQNSVGSGDGGQSCGKEGRQKGPDGRNFPLEDEICKIDACHDGQDILHMLSEGAKSHYSKDTAYDRTVDATASSEEISHGEESKKSHIEKGHRKAI